MLKPIILSDLITEIAIDIDKQYCISGYGFVSCWFTYLENLDVPLFCGDYNSPAGIRIICEENKLKIHCDNPLFYKSIVVETKPNTGSGFISQKVVDLSGAENITIKTATDGATYLLTGPFDANYNVINGTDSTHNYETATNLQIVGVQIGSLAYPCNGHGTQTGNKYSLERFITAYVAE